MKGQNRDLWNFSPGLYKNILFIYVANDMYEIERASCVAVGPVRAENGGSQGDDQPAAQQNDGEERVIFVNAPHQPAKYKNNHITTAKYSCLTFVPLFLFEQFRRYSNCFFLFIALMQVDAMIHFIPVWIPCVRNLRRRFNILQLNLANTRCISDRTLDNIGPTDFHPQRVRFERDSRGRCTYNCYSIIVCTYLLHIYFFFVTTQYE